MVDERRAESDKDKKPIECKQRPDVALDDTDIAILKSYGQGPYAKEIKVLDADLQAVLKRVSEQMGMPVAKVGVKEAETGLAAPSLWDLNEDKSRLKNDQPLQAIFVLM